MKAKYFLSAVPLISVCAAEYPPFYDTTWAGPVQIAENFTRFANYSSGFSLVEATLVMPYLQIPQKPHEVVDEYTASFWIGLDGFTTSDQIAGVRGLWQAGVIMSIWENGTTEYSGFYEWVPNDPISLTTSEFAIREGDHVHVCINTTNAGYHGTTTFTNVNSSQTFSYSQDAPVAWRGPTFPAPGTSAEWIIEAGTYLGGRQYVFPDWGNASFLDAKACCGDGECTVLGDLDTESGNAHMAVVLWNDTQTVYTKSSVDGDRITIQYVEEAFTRSFA